MTTLPVLQQQVRDRTEQTASAHGHWPCRKGCDDCCRQLASPPRISYQEWREIAAAVAALPQETATRIRRRIRDSAHSSRPVVCPLLDTGSGACLVYEARPIACRAYGFYAERQNVLGCSRIESMAQQTPEVIWGNHETLEQRLQGLGPVAEISTWLVSESNHA